MIVVTLGELSESGPSLTLLIQQRLRASVSLRLARLGKRIEEELAHYERSRVELCQRLGTLNPDARHYEFPDPATRATFDAELAELRAEAIQLDGHRPLRLDDLRITCECGHLRELEIEAAHLAALAWLIDEPEETDPPAES